MESRSGLLLVPALEATLAWPMRLPGLPRATPAPSGLALLADGKR